MNLIQRFPSNQSSDFDSLFDNIFTGFPMMVGKPGSAENFSGMRVDIHEDDAGYEITADIPGVKKEDISITLQNDVLTISASKETESEEKKGKVIRRERSSGTYSRSFSVSSGVQQNDIQANFEDGVLTLIIPKLKPEEVEPDVRRITIE